MAANIVVPNKDALYLAFSPQSFLRGTGASPSSTAIDIEPPANQEATFRTITWKTRIPVAASDENGLEELRLSLDAILGRLAGLMSLTTAAGELIGLLGDLNEIVRDDSKFADADVGSFTISFTDAAIYGIRLRTTSRWLNEEWALFGTPDYDDNSGYICCYEFEHNQGTLTQGGIRRSRKSKTGKYVSSILAHGVGDATKDCQVKFDFHSFVSATSGEFANLTTEVLLQIRLFATGQEEAAAEWASGASGLETGQTSSTNSPPTTDPQSDDGEDQSTERGSSSPASQPTISPGQSQIMKSLPSHIIPQNTAASRLIKQLIKGDTLHLPTALQNLTGSQRREIAIGIGLPVEGVEDSTLTALICDKLM